LTRHRDLAARLSLAVALVVAWGSDASLAKDKQPPPQPARETNFPQDFQAAAKVRLADQPADAEKLFLDLAQHSPNARGRDACLARAAECAASQKQYARAMNHARRIEDPCLSRLSQMEIFRAQGQGDAVLRLSQNEDFESWPDEWVYAASLCRARSYAARKDVVNAEKDFRAAIRHTLSVEDQAFAYQMLGNLHRTVSKDETRAMEAYGQVLKLPCSPRRLVDAARARASMLSGVGKADQALAELDRVASAASKDPHWRVVLELCYGDTYRQLGNKTEALARYQRAAASPGARHALIAEAEKRIADLQNSTPRP
jgi:tetratricopeptide (TPR) repeat protein